MAILTDTPILYNSVFKKSHIYILISTYIFPHTHTHTPVNRKPLSAFLNLYQPTLSCCCRWFSPCPLFVLPPPPDHQGDGGNQTGHFITVQRLTASVSDRPVWLRRLEESPRGAFWHAWVWAPGASRGHALPVPFKETIRSHTASETWADGWMVGKEGRGAPIKRENREGGVRECVQW